jgi:hypothetical protein
MKTNAKPAASKNSSLVSAVLDSTNHSQTGSNGVQEGTTVSKFQYENGANGIYTSNIMTPSVDGEYKIVTVLNYKDKNVTPKEIEMTALIDPEGYIYMQSSEGKTRISNAKVSLYYLNFKNNRYELWPAQDYSQYNPQITDDTGKYSFLVPSGNYYLFVEKSGFKSYKSDYFSVQSGSAVYQNILLQKNSWALNFWSWISSKI